MDITRELPDQVDGGLTPSFGRPSVAIDVDRPLSDPRQDALGRSDFARALARLIASHRATEGFVIALCSPWGSGKSTLLNFVEVYLRESTEIPGDHRPVVVRFNPWWFSGSEHLLHQFLNMFMATLSRDRRFARVMQDIGTYAESLEPVASLVPWGGPIIARILAAIRLIVKPTRSPDQLRDKIDAKLKQLSGQILVVIDDIDRLPEQEIRQMLKLVKSVADFPKTIYLLAFDKVKVARALGDPSEERGEEYLRKIVQLEIDIPQPDPVVLRHLLDGGLQEVLGHAFEEGQGAEDWEAMYQDGARHILRTLRDVKRYLNALAITYPFVKDEVYHLDFVIVELLRISAPDVYATVRNNRERFAGGDSEWESAIGGGNPSERKPFYDDMLRKSPQDLQLPVRVLLERLFPKVSSSYGGRPSSSGLNDQWRPKRRVCSPDVFPVYFQLAIPVGEISLETFRDVCRLAENRERLAQALQALADRSRRGEPPGSRLLSFLQRLADHPEEITQASSPAHLDACIGALYDVGDPIYLRDWDNLLPPSVDDLIVWAVEKLLGGGEEISQYASGFMQLGRFERIRHAVVTTPSLYVPLLHVSRMVELNRKTQDTTAGPSVSALPQHELDVSKEAKAQVPGPNSAADPDRLEKLKHLICEKVERAAEDKTLAKAPRLIFTLTKWEEWCAGADVKRRQFVQCLLGTNEGLAHLLGEHVHMSEVQKGPSDPGRVQYTVNLRELSKDVGDRDAMNAQYMRAMGMKLEGQPWLTQRIKLGVDLFGEAWRRAGSRIPDAGS